MSAYEISLSSRIFGSCLAASISDALSSSGVILLIAFKRATRSAKLLSVDLDPDFLAPAYLAAQSTLQG